MNIQAPELCFRLWAAQLSHQAAPSWISASLVLKPCIHTCFLPRRKFHSSLPATQIWCLSSNNSPDLSLYPSPFSASPRFFSSCLQLEPAQRRVLSLRLLASFVRTRRSGVGFCTVVRLLLGMRCLHRILECLVQVPSSASDPASCECAPWKAAGDDSNPWVPAAHLGDLG